MAPEHRARVLMPAALVLAAALVPPAGAQVVLDRVLVRVNGDIVTASDVRQARRLRLLPAVADTDEAVLQALVDRRLMLEEVARTPPQEPDGAAVAARRRAWEAALGGAPAATLAEAGMSEASLAAWLADDLRIEAYISQRFAVLAGRDREAAIDRWIRGLRSRADIR